MSDSLKRYSNESIRLSFVDAKEACEEIVSTHSAKGEEAKELCCCILATLLLADSLKEEKDSVLLTYVPISPSFMFDVSSTQDGKVRGRLIHNDSTPSISLLRISKLSGQFGGSSSTIECPTLEEGLSSFLKQSEEIESSFSFDLCFSKDGSLSKATALLLQALPGCEKDAFQKFEKEIEKCGDFSNLMPEQFPNSLTLVSEKEPLVHCDCSRAKSLSMLHSLRDEDLLSLLSQEETILTCPFCKKEYSFSQVDIKALIENRRRR